MPTDTDGRLSEADRAKAVRLGRRVDWALTAFTVIVAIVFIYMLIDLPQRATFFPWFITISIVVIATVYSINKWRMPSRWDAHFDPTLSETGGERDTGPSFFVAHARGILRAMVSFFALIAATLVIGPEYAVPIFLTLALWLGGENRIAALISGIVFWAIIHFVFGDAMSINLPKGLLTEAIGF